MEAETKDLLDQIIQLKIKSNELKDATRLNIGTINKFYKGEGKFHQSTIEKIKLYAKQKSRANTLNDTNSIIFNASNQTSAQIEELINMMLIDKRTGLIDPITSSFISLVYHFVIKQKEQNH